MLINFCKAPSPLALEENSHNQAFTFVGFLFLFFGYQLIGLNRDDKLDQILQSSLSFGVG